MPANANTGKRPENSQTREPAKGCIKPANEDTYLSATALSRMAIRYGT